MRFLSNVIIALPVSIAFMFAAGWAGDAFGRFQSRTPLTAQIEALHR
ncbi:hypothetical protein [Bradyrhizobium sp. SZCCHNS3053]|nr:hypothetical protein [Bradyrhizobium sp. SZCCHNS3053]